MNTIKASGRDIKVGYDTETKEVRIGPYGISFDDFSTLVKTLAGGSTYMTLGDNNGRMLEIHTDANCGTININEYVTYDPSHLKISEQGSSALVGDLKVVERYQIGYSQFASLINNVVDEDPLLSEGLVGKIEELGQKTKFRTSFQEKILPAYKAPVKRNNFDYLREI